MSRQYTGKAFNQGVLARIRDWFIKPLLRYRDPEAPMRESLEKLFRADTCDIDWYVSIDNFRMLGVDVINPYTRIAGTNYRMVGKGTMMLMRHDMTMPNIYEIDINLGQGGQNHVYQLTHEEWSKTERFLKQVPKNKQKRQRLLKDLRC